MARLNYSYGEESVNSHSGLNAFSFDDGDSITNQYYMGGNCK